MGELSVLELAEPPARLESNETQGTAKTGHPKHCSEHSHLMSDLSRGSQSRIEEALADVFQIK